LFAMDTWQNSWALLHLALPILSVLSFGRSAPHRGLAWCMVAGIALYQVILLSVLLTLGHLEILFPPYYRAALATAASVMLVAAIISVPAWLRAIAAIRYRPKLVDVVLAVTIAVFLRMTWWEIRFDWTDGPFTFDSLAYHIPRVAMWSWHGNFHPYQTAVWHQIGYVVGGSGTVLPLTLMGRGWLGGAWTGLVMAWASMAAVFVIARTFNLSGRSALMGALALGACPVVGMRMSDITTDICAAFPVLAGVVLFLTLTRLRNGIFCFIVLSGVGVASKQYVAFPVFVLSLVLFLPRAKEILSRRENVLSLLAGTAVAGVTCLLSFYPIYEAFGTITGGEEARVLVSWNYGWQEVRHVTLKMLVNWLLEPLSVFHLLAYLSYVPAELSQRLSDSLGVPWVYSLLDNHETWYPIFTPFNTRSGLLPLLLFPWLIMAVPRGRRLMVTGLFILLYISQTSIVVTNYFAARFVVILLAAFALLWAARAERNPFVVSLFVFLGIYAEYRYVAVYHKEYIPYSLQREFLGAADPYIKQGEFFWLISTALANDGRWTGKLGQYRFKYTICPKDGDWVSHFKKLGGESRWLILQGNGEQFKPGPTWDSLLTHECKPEKISTLRTWLKEAGWHHKIALPDLYELWTTDPASTPIPTTSP